MLVANSFDLWQQDSFFSAAEEVQESTDILESAYRNWVRQKKEQISSSDLDDLRREVQTALGTAKWQLEEFERAVNQSYGSCRDQNNKMARHQQFVGAIESQISRVEDTLRETSNAEGKQAFRWVNLNENERDDLAMFLTGSPGTFTKTNRDKVSKPSIGLVEENLINKRDTDYVASSSSSSSGMATNVHSKGSNTSRDEVVINVGQPNSLIELSPREAIGSRGELNNETERVRGAKRTHVSTSSGLLKVVIPDDDRMKTIEATPKEKGIKKSSLLQFSAISYFNKQLRCSGGTSSKIHSSRRIQFNSSMRLIIIFVLSFFLLVPYLLHSS